MRSEYAVIFPGQGSQHVGMLTDLMEKYPIINKTLSQAGEYLGYDLAGVIAKGPEEKLNSTDITQPALLAAGVALWRLISEQNPVKPTFMAGHSLGEYTALVCAQAIDFGDALKLVQARGQYMQEAVPLGFGSMAAIIGLDNDLIVALCEEAAEGDVVAPANFNAIGQTVVAGENAAVERLIDLAKVRGAKLAKKISVSVPSHCELMKPAKIKLVAALASVSIKTPQCSILHNVDVQSHEDPNDIRHALAEQLDHPVRWVETIQQLSVEGVTTLWECGPGKVLAGLVKRIDKDLNVINLCDDAQLKMLLTEQY